MPVPAGLRQFGTGASTVHGQAGTGKWRNLRVKGSSPPLAGQASFEAAPGRDIGNTVAGQGGRGTGTESGGVADALPGTPAGSREGILEPPGR